MDSTHRKERGGVAGKTAIEWADIQNCFDKLVNFLRSTQDRDGKCAISVEDYMNAYTRIFNMHVKSNTAEAALRPRRAAARSVQLSSREETTLTTLMELFRTWLRDVLRLYAKKPADVPMLEHFGILWEDFSIVMRVTGKVLKPIENSKYSNISIRRTSAKVFAEEVLRDEKSNFHLAETFLRGVRSLREGEDVKISQLKCIVDAYLSASIRGEKDEDTLYVRDLQTPYLKETVEFYSANGNEWFHSESVSGYLRKVTDVIAREQEQVTEYLPLGTVNHVMTILLSELVGKYDHRLIMAEKGGLNELLRDVRKEEISLMFSLMADLSSSRELMATQFRRFLEVDGVLLVEKHAQASSLNMIECARDVLKFHKTYSDIAFEYFHQSYEHMTALRKGFQCILKMEIKDAATKRAISLSEIFCVYCDAILRGRGVRMDDDEKSAEMDNIVILFDFLSDQDVFQAFYRRLLSKRLLSDSCNLWMEKLMITKMKEKHTPASTAQMDVMIQDIDLMDVIDDLWNGVAKHGPQRLPFDSSAKVLTTGRWPSFQPDSSPSIKLPAGLPATMEVFGQVYAKKYPTRVLKWNHGISTAVIRGRFALGDKDIHLSAYQAVVVLFIGGMEKDVTVEEIATAVQMDPKDVRKAIVAMSRGKHAIILRKKNEAFGINHKFRSASRRVRIPHVLQKMGAEESASIRKASIGERDHVIDALIVRTMKARKVITHTELMELALSNLNVRFKTEPSKIKRRIGDLIDKDYIRRDREDLHKYHYVA
eukprot:TRINITY_DN24763_c0_g1_i1.p1 TRINITY_DN24763_c0_g1~~TRINITY_DN24763_c0_g1_i1.p1  ORF type:complete len:767 (+),score=192.49 TRINITY_DN24763_c0_g1_i1:91-2391(+)